MIYGIEGRSLTELIRSFAWLQVLRDNVGFVSVGRIILRKDRIVPSPIPMKTAKEKSQHAFKPAFWFRVSAALLLGSIETTSLSCLVFIAI